MAIWDDFNPSPTNPLYGPSALLKRLFGGSSATPSSMISAPVAQPINAIGGVGAGASLGRLGPMAGMTPDQQALAKLQQLREQLLSQSQGMSMGDMQSQAGMSAGLQFDPQIAQIEALMNRAKKETKNQQGVVKGTYEDLAKSYSGDIKRSKATAAEAREIEQAQLQDMKNQLKDDYADSMSMVRDKLSQLGIEEAGPDALTGLAEDVGQYSAMATRESGDAQRAINTREQGDVEYYSKGAPVARMAGAEGVQQLSKALQDYLFQQQGQLGQLQAQKQLSYMSALNQMQNQQASLQSDVWSRLKDISSQEQKLLKPKAFGSGLSGASNYLTEQFTNDPYDRKFGAGEAKRYLGALQTIVTSLGGTNMRMSPEQMIAKAAQYARTNGISERILTRAMMTYLGKG